MNIKVLGLIFPVLLLACGGSGGGGSTQPPVSTIAVTGVTLKANTTLVVGGTEQLTATISPANATNKNILWTTSDTAIATITSGLVSAIAPGTVAITVTTEDGAWTAGCAVTIVPASIAVTGISLKSSTSLIVGSTEQLTPTITPGNATNQNVTWTTSNATIATINAGLVSAIAPGTATITATTVDGARTATCVVTVSNAAIAVTGVHLKSSTSLIVGGTEQLVPAITPANATNQNVIWTTGDATIATIHGGLVSGISQGATTITVTTEDGAWTASCAVTVAPAPIAVTAVSLKSTTTLVVGVTEQLTPTFTPADATNQNVTWETSNAAIATISGGLVTGVAPGAAAITVTTEDGNRSSTCVVTVVPGLKGKVAVVCYASDLGYSDLLTQNGAQVTTLPYGQIQGTDFTTFDLIIIVSDSMGTTWVPTSKFAGLQTPIIGLGEAGTVLFGNLDSGSAIKAGHCWSGTMHAVLQVDASSPIWQTPYRVEGSNGDVTVSSPACYSKAAYLPAPIPGDVTLIGREDDDTDHYLIARQGNWLMWGFDEDVQLTQDGKHLFVNLVYSMM